MSSMSPKKLPFGWSVAYVEEIADIKSGKRLPKGIGLTKSDNGYPYIRVADMANGTVDLNNIMFVPRDVVKFIKKYIITTNDIYISVAGTLGLVGIIPNELNNANLTENANRLTNLKCNKLFLLYSLQTENIKRTIQSVQTLGAQPKLAIERIKKFEIILPPTGEQQKIAQALTDADNYISALEKLIEKKKMMKEGLINRFFSNNQDWKELTLFDIAENNRSLFNDGDWIEAEYITSEGVRLIQTGNIGIGKYVDKEANKKYVSEASFQLLNCKVLKDQDILICRLAEPAGRACIFHATSEKTITSVDVTIFRPKTEKYNRIFLVYAMSMPTWFSKISENVGGTTHKRISRSNLGEITIKVPNLATQNRIAQILTSMDNQLDLLIGKLEKAKSIKIGMMQKLLTGEIRLA